MIVFGVAMLTLGVGFLLVAAIGLVRLPDPFQRMHSATKAGTLGTSLIVLGTLLLDQTARLSTGLLTILFLLLTLPIGAQLLGRAAYLSGARMEGVDDDPLADVLDRGEPKATDRPD